MTRRRWVWDDETKSMVEVTTPDRPVKMHYIQPDIAGFVSPIDGQAITSRRAMRNHMARHDVVPYEPVKRKDVSAQIKAQRISALRDAYERARDQARARS